MRVMMRKLLTNVTRYINRNVTPYRVCSSSISESPRRMNPVSAVTLGIVYAFKSLSDNEKGIEIDKIINIYTEIYRQTQW